MVGGKKGFTIIEVLIALLIFSVVSLTSMGIMTAVGRTNQSVMENHKNRSANFINLTHLIRDIQSADGVEISGDGKTMKVKYLDGRSDIEYKINKGNFEVEGVNMFYVDQEKSYFDKEGSLVEFHLHTRHLESLNAQRESIVSTKVMIRKEIE